MYVPKNQFPSVSLDQHAPFMDGQPPSRPAPPPPRNPPHLPPSPTSIHLQRASFFQRNGIAIPPPLPPKPPELLRESSQGYPPTPPSPQGFSRPGYQPGLPPLPPKPPELRRESSQGYLPTPPITPPPLPRPQSQMYGGNTLQQSYRTASTGGQLSEHINQPAPPKPSLQRRPAIVSRPRSEAASPRRDALLRELKQMELGPDQTIRTTAGSVYEKYHGRSTLQMEFDVNPHQLAEYMLTTPKDQQSGQGFWRYLEAKSGSGLNYRASHGMRVEHPEDAVAGAIEKMMASLRKQLNAKGIDIASGRRRNPSNAAAASRPSDAVAGMTAIETDQAIARLDELDLGPVFTASTRAESVHARHAGRTNVRMEFDIDPNKLARYMATTAPEQRSPEGFWNYLAREQGSVEYRSQGSVQIEHPLDAVAEDIRRQMGKVMAAARSKGVDIDKLAAEGTKHRLDRQLAQQGRRLKDILSR